MRWVRNEDTLHCIDDLNLAVDHIVIHTDLDGNMSILCSMEFDLMLNVMLFFQKKRFVIHEQRIDC